MAAAARPARRRSSKTPPDAPRYEYGDQWWLHDKNECDGEQTKNKLSQTIIFVIASVASVVAAGQSQRSGVLVWSASPAKVARSPLIPLPALLTYRLCAFAFTAAISLSYTMSPYVTIAWENLSGTRAICERAGFEVSPLQS